VPDFLQTFAPSADPQDQQICKMRQDMMKLGIRTFIDLMTSAVGAAGFAFGAPMITESFSPVMTGVVDQLSVLFGINKGMVQGGLKLSDDTMESIGGNIKGLPTDMARAGYDMLTGEIKSLIKDEISGALFPGPTSSQAPGA